MFQRLIQFIFGRSPESPLLVRGCKVKPIPGGSINIEGKRCYTLDDYKRGYTSSYILGAPSHFLIEGWKHWAGACGKAWGLYGNLPPSPEETLKIIAVLEEGVKLERTSASDLRTSHDAALKKMAAKDDEIRRLRAGVSEDEEKKHLKADLLGAERRNKDLRDTIRKILGVVEPYCREHPDVRVTQAVGWYVSEVGRLERALQLVRDDLKYHRRGHTSHTLSNSFVDAWKRWAKECGDTWDKNVALPPSTKELLKIIEFFEKKVEYYKDLYLDGMKEIEEVKESKEGAAVTMWLARDETARDGKAGCHSASTYLYTREPSMDCAGGEFHTGEAHEWLLMDQHFGLDPAQKRKVKATFEEEK